MYNSTLPWLCDIKCTICILLCTCVTSSTRNGVLMWTHYPVLCSEAISLLLRMPYGFLHDSAKFDFFSQYEHRLHSCIIYTCTYNLVSKFYKIHHQFEICTGFLPDWKVRENLEKTISGKVTTFFSFYKQICECFYRYWLSWNYWGKTCNKMAKIVSEICVQLREKIIGTFSDFCSGNPDVNIRKFVIW